MPGRRVRARRFAPSYDLEGPRVTLGLIWFVVVFAALGLGRFLSDFPLVGVVYALVAAVAAMQITDAWMGRRDASMFRYAAAVIAFAVGSSAAFGARMLGVALLGSIAFAVLTAAGQVVKHKNIFASIALLLEASLPVGVVAASINLTTSYEIGAVVILLATAMAFDVGDFLIGSGAGSVVEGPIAGAVMVGLVGAVAAIIGAPPFHGSLAWAFAAGAAVACPLGQVVASALLPDATVRASALRRLDSLILLAPLWALFAGIVAAHT